MDVREELAFLLWGLLGSLNELLRWIKAHPYQAFVVETGFLLLMMGATWGALHWMKQGRSQDEHNDECL
jgi:hypothetical protein